MMNGKVEKNEEKSISAIICDGKWKTEKASGKVT